ncbi:MAG: protease pro-enzyme activation domain-containing protein [Terracidiphilus sp.]|jgi:kumamolisin
MIRRTSLFVFSIVAVLTIVAANSHAQTFTSRHVRDVVLNGQAQPVGYLPETQIMHVDIVLPLRDKGGLDAFVADVYDPSSPNYRHFLTPDETSAKFGPTQESWNALVSFATSNGFRIENGSLKKRDLVLTGTVSAIESAFHVTMRTYQHPTENRVFFSPDREPTVNLPFQLEHISGLDNYSIPHTMLVKRSDYAAAHGISEDEAVSHATTGSGPSASFLGSDMRAAYYGGTALTGAGQTIGLFEYEGTDLSDLTAYYTNVGQTEPVTPKLVSVDGTSTSCTMASGSCDDGEQNLDMTQAMGMAPGLAALTMYIGGTDSAIISAMTSDEDGPLPGTIGCSWGWTPADTGTLDGYFETMSAQGQNFFAASGDSSTWSSSNEAWPADDDYVVSVGGTDLTTASAAGPWKSETAWTDSGGGITPDSITIPSWQKLSGVINSSNKGSTTLRNGPDVSANANFTFYTCDDQGKDSNYDGAECGANVFGGTSFAAPMWAGYVALLNQQYAANNPTASVKSIGFIDPLIYPIGVSSSFDTDFHDITSGTSGSYSAVTGYDLVTGWGTPNGANLINALAGSSTGTASFSLNATAASVTDGSTGTSTVTEAVTGGFDSAVTLTASGMPSGVTAAFSPTSITGAGTSTLTFTASSTATPGTYTITVTGTPVSGTAEQTTLTLTVSAAASPNFTVTDSPASLSIAQGSNGTSTITVTSKNSFSAATTLTATGLPTGVTAAFSPNPVTPAANSAATSTLTLTASSTATVGTATVTITGTSGSLVNTTTLALTITSSGSVGAQTAVFNSTLLAPGCATVGTSCDSGPSLLLGRGKMKNGAEPNQPNTINDSCADGQSGTFHSAESNDRIVVASTSGGALTHGQAVTVTATVWTYATSGSSKDYLDVYYAANASSPSWVLVKTIAPTTTGASTLSTTYTLPTGSLQAVRANFRSGGSAAVCTTGSYDDHDDLIFAVE